MDSITVRFPSHGVTERWGDYWRAYSYDFGISTYGRTRSSARQKMDEAVHLLVKTMAARGGVPRIENRMRNAGLLFQILDDDDRPVAYDLTREMELVV